MPKLIFVSLMLCALLNQAQETMQYSVYFNSNASKPAKQSSIVFDSVIQFMADKNLAGIRVTGYADSTGSAELNLRLSGKRAHTIADTLAKRAAQLKNIAIEFYGKERPRYTNSTKEGRAKNRRVDIDIKLQKSCPFTYYGPSGEVVEVDTDDFKGYDCSTIEAEFNVVTNQQQLENSKVFTAKTVDGDGLWSGGMLRCCFRRDSAGIPLPINLTGYATLKLPKSVYQNNGMDMYAGVDVNGKIVWALDTSLKLTDKGDFYRIRVSLQTLCRGINADKRKACLCQQCVTGFVAGIFPTQGERNVSVTKSGITLKTDDSKTGYAITDVWDDCFLTHNHIYSNVSTDKYGYYRHLFSVDEKEVSAADHLPAQTAMGNSRLYFCKDVNTPDSVMHLYEWSGKAGAWQAIDTPLQKVLTDAGCSMHWFPVKETGLYMITEKSFDTHTLIMKMRKKFTLFDGYTVCHKNAQKAPAVILPVTKSGKIFTATLPADNDVSVSCVFRKGHKYYLFNYTVAQLQKMANGKTLKIKKKMLQFLPNNNAEDALEKLCPQKEQKEKDFIPCGPKG